MISATNMSFALKNPFSKKKDQSFFYQIFGKCEQNFVYHKYSIAACNLQPNVFNFDQGSLYHYGKKHGNFIDKINHWPKNSSVVGTFGKTVDDISVESRRERTVMKCLLIETKNRFETTGKSS